MDAPTARAKKLVLLGRDLFRWTPIWLGRTPIWLGRTPIWLGQTQNGPTLEMVPRWKWSHV